MSIDFEIVEDGIARITLNRPERNNAFDEEHYRDLSLAWARVRDDQAIRVAIITGAGEKSFSSGADLKSFFGKRTATEMWLTQKDQLLNRGLEIWKPIVAAVNGYCLGGGMTLLMATDVRVAAEHATFALSEVKRGIVAGNGGTQRILDQLPRAIAMEVLLTGDRFDAATAERLAVEKARAVAGQFDDAFAAIGAEAGSTGEAVVTGANAGLATQNNDNPTGTPTDFANLNPNFSLHQSLSSKFRLTAHMKVCHGTG